MWGQVVGTDTSTLGRESTCTYTSTHTHTHTDTHKHSPTYQLLHIHAGTQTHTHRHAYRLARSAPAHTLVERLNAIYDYSIFVVHDHSVCDSGISFFGPGNHNIPHIQTLYYSLGTMEFSGQQNGEAPT